jgi:hypothetical protein
MPRVHLLIWNPGNPLFPFLLSSLDVKLLPTRRVEVAVGRQQKESKEGVQAASVITQAVNAFIA